MKKYTAIITGGTKGIGADLAQRLLNKGYDVISIARSYSKTTHPNLFSFSADLLDPAEVANVSNKIIEDHKVTHLIHNAGLIWPNLIEDASPEEIAGLSQLHLGAALTLLRAVLPNMKSSGFGRVIFNGSRAALGCTNRTAYSATKAAMVGMARTWALELAPYGITVNVISPGPIQTDNFWGIIDKGSQQEKELANRIPVGRLGKTRDVSKAFEFFCDPENSFVTGQNLYVCGGASIGSIQI